MTLGLRRHRRHRRQRRLAITSPGVIVIDPRRDATATPTERWRDIASPAGVAIASLGAMHIVRPRWFSRPVGLAFPTNRRVWTTVLGAAEMALGTAVYNPRTRAAGSLGSAVLVGVMTGRASRRPRAGHRGGDDSTPTGVEETAPVSTGSEIDRPQVAMRPTS